MKSKGSSLFFRRKEESIPYLDSTLVKFPLKTGDGKRVVRFLCRLVLRLRPGLYPL